ncbi:hypothetical protein ABDI30_24380 [Paenibacillus cisolokensis]|uniref:hypothetical protein n=1 Tax=Paenibacillus cisolokensis TaxID=1658519 RepID=UPI003D2650D8
MKLRRLVVSVLAIVLSLSFTRTSSYADTVTASDVNEFSSVVVTTNTSEPAPSELVSPFALASFSYSNLQPNDLTTITSNRFSITSYQDVTVSIYQYPSSGGGTASVLYSLGAAEKGPISVYGNYSSVSGTITWYNVPPGTYYIKVENIGRVAVSGRGTVN